MYCGSTLVAQMWPSSGAALVLSAGNTGLMLHETALNAPTSRFACSGRRFLPESISQKGAKASGVARPLSPGISYLALPPKAPVAEGSSEDETFLRSGASDGPAPASARAARDRLPVTPAGRCRVIRSQAASRCRNFRIPAAPGSNKAAFRKAELLRGGGDARRETTRGAPAVSPRKRG